jgi:hypothetical protein
MKKGGPLLDKGVYALLGLAKVFRRMKTMQSKSTVGFSSVLAALVLVAPSPGFT